MFITLHMVSTNNGRQNILKDDIELALSMVDARDEEKQNRYFYSNPYCIDKDFGGKVPDIGCK